MKNSKRFTLGQVLSITTGRLCCDMGEVYEILNHVTGDDLFTHVLPRAAKFARPLIVAQHPDLAVAGTNESKAKLDAAIKESATPMAGVKKWLTSLKLKPTYDVASHSAEWESNHPLQDLADEIGGDRVKTRCAVVTP